MTTELRCPSRVLHGVLQDNGLLEVKCKNVRCGHEAGVVVMHYFDPISGDLVKTRKFQEPNNQFNRKKEAARCR